MSAREVITIQCGHFSNFIGTHWWNLQEAGFCYDSSSKDPREILHDCTFREGLTLTGEQTYTPRLIALDLSGSLKTLKEDGTLYETPTKQHNPNPAWEGEVEKHAAEPPERNEFLTDLDRMDAEEEEEQSEASRGALYPSLNTSVEVWSDFLRIHLHPNSTLMVPGHFHNESNPQGSFDMYPAGLQAWEDRKFQHALEDQLHFFVEECDHLQGFHLLADWDTGFGAVASAVAQEIRDEFGGGKGLLTVLSSPLAQPLDKQSPSFYTAMLNNALALDGLVSPSSMLCPLSLLHNPWRSGSHLRTPPSLVNYQPALLYHSSAVMASALDTASLIYRTEQSVYSLPSLCDRLTAFGRKICNVGVCLPLLIPPECPLITELDRNPLTTALLPLSPFCSQEDVRWAQAITLRGITDKYTLCSREDPRFTYCRHPSHVVADHLSEHCPGINSLFCTVQKPLPINPPFPVVFPPGCYDGSYYNPMQVPMAASFHSQSGIHQLLNSLLLELKAINMSRFPTYTASCLDRDSHSELLQSFSSLADNYQTTPTLDESSDSD